MTNYFKYKRLEFSSLDILSFIFIFLLFINPYYIYDIGFELSFLITEIFFISDKTCKLFYKTMLIIGSFYFSQIQPDNFKKVFIRERGNNIAPVIYAIFINHNFLKTLHRLYNAQFYIHSPVLPETSDD